MEHEPFGTKDEEYQAQLTPVYFAHAQQWNPATNEWQEPLIPAQLPNGLKVRFCEKILLVEEFDQTKQAWVTVMTLTPEISLSKDPSSIPLALTVIDLTANLLTLTVGRNDHTIFIHKRTNILEPFVLSRTMNLAPRQNPVSNNF